MRVLTISGSLRPDSLNTLLLRAAEEQAPAGVQLVRFTGLADIPPFHGERSDPGERPAAVRELSEQIQAADALLIATPEYNGSIPGVLKNAIDWASRPISDSPLSGKPLAIMGAGGAGGTIRAQLALRQLSTAINTLIINRPQVQITRSWEKFDTAGKLT